jgi:TolB-like protein/AraC-like DNA-binding protein
MPEAFINRIKQIILNHIENDKFGVSELAIELGLSRSQILRKVKASTGKSANQLIREIRLEEAVKLLREDDLTASEIAYKVGFSSPSYFNKCFLDQYGFTPGDFKKQNINEIEAIHQQEPVQSFFSKPLGIILVSAFIITTIVISFIIRNQTTNGKKDSMIQHASIAVLPLLDLSENKNKEFLAVGLTDAITLELSRLEGLRVISRGSAMMFQDSTKLYSEIAKKLGVDLLLEGSVIYGSDSLRVIVQLIEPFPNEKHLWANKYDQSSSNIFNLADDISNQIAKEIHLVVSPEITTTEVKPVNPKAFELYLRGRYLWSNNNTKAVESAIEYLKESIAIDSNYAPAYSILAEAYISMNKFIRDEEKKLQNKKESRNAIDIAISKAIELDGSLAEAYITKGNILAKFDWDWEGMKKMAEKGLELNPNNSYGHILLSKYYLVKGNFKKSIQQALVAETLNPLNPRTGCLVAERYFLAKEFEKSINQYKKVLELYPRYGFAWDGIGYAQFVSGKKEEAMKSWQNLFEIMGNHDMAEYYGLNETEVALNHWLDEATKKESKLFCSNPTIVAQAYMFVNNNEGALRYLERAFDVRNEDLPIIMIRPHYAPLHNEIRFKELVKKVGITILP